MEDTKYNPKLSNEENIRALYDMVNRLERQMNEGDVWDNKVKAERNSLEILDLTDQSINLEFQVATLEINAL